jgi:hypothetical protein
MFDPFEGSIARVIVGYVVNGKNMVVLYKIGDKKSGKYKGEILILKIGCSK